MTKRWLSFTFSRKISCTCFPRTPCLHLRAGIPDAGRHGGSLEVSKGFYKCYAALHGKCCEQIGPSQKQRKLERLSEAINSLDGERDGVDLQTFACLTKECSNLRALSEGRQLHANLKKAGVDEERFLALLLLVMYAKCGDVDSAQAVFDKIRKRNVILWTALIGAYVRNGFGRVAFETFDRMQQDHVKPNKVTFLTILAACCSPSDLSEGQKIHSQIVRAGVELDLALANALITMYGKCGSLEGAWKIFKGISEKDVISWTAMIGAYAHNKHGKEAIELFHRMEQASMKPNRITFINIVNACTVEGAVETGKAIHSLIADSGLEADLNVGNALIHMYGKFGEVECSRRIFKKMPRKDVISWTAMISACASNSRDKEGFQFFHVMKQDGVKPNKISFMSVLEICAKRAALKEGKLIHAEILESGLAIDAPLASTLVNMYKRCGALKDAHRVFHEAAAKDLVLWNTMLSAYSEHGLVDSVVRLFRQMQQGNVKPDAATYISVLTACSRAGLVDEGIHYFHSMKIDHNLQPLTEHYGCMVDLLGRAGRLDSAEELVMTMPFEAGPVTWMTLLSACSLYGDLERAKRAASMVIKLDPQNHAPYVLLSNMLAQEESAQN